MQKLLLFLFLIPTLVFSQKVRPEAYLDHKQFESPDGKILLEVYLQFNISTFRLLRNEAGLFYGKIELTEIVKRGEEIIDFRKVTLDSPLMVDSLINDFSDQHRFSLDPGYYNLEFEIRDVLNDSSEIVRSHLPVELKKPSQVISISDIQQLEGYTKAETQGPLTKGGYDLIPFVSNYYSPDIEKLAYYFEIYRSEQLGNGEMFLLKQYIREKNNGEPVDQMAKISRQNVKPVVPVLSVFDIKNLPTGSYELVVELRNKANELLAEKSFEFIRTNVEREFKPEDILKVNLAATFVEKISNNDSINEFISCLRPIAMPNEIGMIDTIVNSKDINLKKQFFYYFWANRDPLSTEMTWIKYKQTVDYVNRIFGTKIKRGYQTDRGYVFLKYGAPNWVTDRPNEPSSYPYQIWQYKKVGKFNNKRFIFYLPDLVTNDYVMLHSDVPGEVRNYRWEQMLNNRNSPNINIDEGNGGNNQHWGGNSGEFYKNPR